MDRAHPAERTLVFLDHLERWLKDEGARTALGVDQAALDRMCEKETLRSVVTPLGRLICPHSVNSLRAKAEAEEEAP